jgi:ABC-type multidrug transport system fused ATPase/permease subunit
MCSDGAYYNQTFLPLGLLIAFDIICLIFLCALKIRKRFAVNRAARKATPPMNKGNLLKRAGTVVGDMAKVRKNHNYVTLDGEDIPFESRIASVQRTQTGFMAAMEPDFMADENFARDEKPSSELQLFVQSLSKCMDTTKIGLNFEFYDLEFKPRKSKKYILSEVTGRIPRGSFCAVMGGSGAGKSTFLNVLMGKTAHTGGITKVNGLKSEISKSVIPHIHQTNTNLNQV